MSFNVSARSVSIPTYVSLACRAFVSAFVLFVIACSPASATVGHHFTDQFGEVGNGNGQFAPGGPSGVAVVPSSGDVLVTDPWHVGSDGVSPEPRIERFDATGAFVDAFSIDAGVYNAPGALAVDAASGAVYVTVFDAASVPQILKYSAAGVFEYALDPSSSNTTFNYIGAAVDPGNGRVYVSAFGNEQRAPRIDVFDSATGAFIESFDGSTNSPSGPLTSCPAGSLAVDTAHRLYVTDTACTHTVVRYTSAGAYDATIDDGSLGTPVDATADPSSGQVFVAESGPTGPLQIASYSGTTRGQVLDAAAVGGVAQLAVDPTSGTIYAADNGNGVIARFTTFDGPTVTTTAAAPVAATSATLNGTIDPGGVATDYHFEYGLNNSYGTSTPTSGAGSGSGPVAVSAAISGLTPNQTYHYRLIGTNAGGSIPSEDHTLTTSAIMPTIVGTPSASSMGPTSVRIHGVVDPNHAQTGWHVDYGTDTTYGSSSGPDEDTGAGTAGVPVDVNIDGLAPATTYHYRITADNVAGDAHGPDATFRTAPAAPASASDVTTTDATLVGTIDPHGVATTYHFEYGLSTSYALRTPEAAGGSSSGEKTVTAAISGLRSAATYHVRVVATSGSDTWYGADGTFTTPPVPTNTVSAVTGVGTTTATLNGTVDTHGVAGTYQFEVSSLTSAYTLVSPERALGAASGERGVAEAMSGLPAGETFTVRLMSNSQDGTGYSDQVTFATAPVPTPRVFPAPPPAETIGAYGCTAPRLNAYDRRPDPGDVITITGTDLGVGGTVSLGSASPTPTDWTSTGFSITVPDDAGGTLPLTINCGTESNTVAVAIFQAPSNAFSITKSLVSGTTATLSVKVPGPGKVETSASGTAAAKKTAKKAGAVKIAVKLSRAGKKALAKAKRDKLKVSVKVRFTPAGGTAATLTKTLTFKTGSKR